MPRIVPRCPSGTTRWALRPSSKEWSLGPVERKSGGFQEVEGYLFRDTDLAAACIREGLRSHLRGLDHLGREQTVRQEGVRV